MNQEWTEATYLTLVGSFSPMSFIATRRPRCPSRNSGSSIWAIAASQEGARGPRARRRIDESSAGPILTLAVGSSHHVEQNRVRVSSSDLGSQAERGVCLTVEVPVRDVPWVPPLPGVAGFAFGGPRCRFCSSRRPSIRSLAGSRSRSCRAAACKGSVPESRRRGVTKLRAAGSSDRSVAISSEDGRYPLVIADGSRRERFAFTSAASRA